MRKLVVGTFLTLDGVMQAPGAPEEDRDGGFANGGWVVPIFDDELGASMVEWIEGIGALLLGRRTYEIFASHWPLTGPDDPIGAAFGRVPKYVASRTLQSADWEGTTVIDDVPGAVRALKGANRSAVRAQRASPSASRAPMATANPMALRVVRGPKAANRSAARVPRASLLASPAPMATANPMAHRVVRGPKAASRSVVRAPRASPSASRAPMATASRQAVRVAMRAASSRASRVRLAPSRPARPAGFARRVGAVPAASPAADTRPDARQKGRPARAALSVVDGLGSISSGSACPHE